MQLIAEDTLIPQELIDRSQWVLWKLENVNDKKIGQPKYDKKTGEIVQTKVPYQLNGYKAASTSADHLSSYDDVMRNVENYSGIGYVLNADDPYTAIDLDDCVIDGEITKEARSIIESLNSYTEYSQSGKGLHIFVKGKKPGTRSKNSNKGFEMYDRDRFIIMTGNHLEGTPLEINEEQEVINYLYDSYFSNSKPDTGTSIKNVDIKESPSMSDDKVMKIASNAKNGDKFKTLYSGDFTSYGSQSEADQALCNILSFYTQDFEQIDRIFTGSGLYRDKWDRQDYKANTIKKAIDGLGSTFQRQDFKLHVKNSASINLKEALQARHFEELEKMHQEWELNGSNGRKPTTISPLRCAIILADYVDFILFDLEENTRVAMYQPDEGIYTRNTTLIKRVISWIEPKLNSNKADEVIYHLTNRAEVKEETASRYLIPVRNGVFNLKTKTLEPFNPDYVFTTKIATPYTHNPANPVIDSWDVESWLESLACGDKEIVHLLWQVINDSLNGNYSRKKAIFLVGEGNNGKGTLQELITNLIGFENIATLKVNEFEERFRLGLLEGKTVVIGDDVPANVYIDDSSNFNSVVTGDTVLVELKNRHPYSAVFRCTVIQSTNGMPKFRNKTKGTTRRLVIVPFNADFNGTIENFKIKDEYIQNEKVLQYVLHKAIRMDFERFDIPKASEQELEVFKQDNDPILDFKLSVFDEWKIPEVPKSIVYELYKKFCKENGYKPLSNRAFHHQFKNHLGNTWVDGQKRFRYDELLPHVGDLDYMGIGFPNKEIPLRSYKRNISVAQV